MKTVTKESHGALNTCSKPDYGGPRHVYDTTMLRSIWANLAFAASRSFSFNSWCSAATVQPMASGSGGLEGPLAAKFQGVEKPVGNAFSGEKR